MYFLHSDTDGIPQVWKLDANGENPSQVSFGDQAVQDYDIAADGSLAFVTAKGLYVQAPGVNQPSPWLVIPQAGTNLKPHAPRWAPGSNLLAYASGGIWIGRTANTVRLLNLSQVDPSARILPYQWSPDGRWLLVSIDYPDRSELGILDPSNSALKPLRLNPTSAACCQAAWAPDSQGVVIANPFPAAGAASASGGLWWAGLDGVVKTLLAENSPDGTLNYVGWPHFGPTGILNYAFANFPQAPGGRFPMALYQSSLSTPDLRQLLRPESFFIEQVLWAPDGSLAILQLPQPGSVWNNGGPLLFVHPEQDLPRPLFDQGYNLKWGP